MLMLEDIEMIKQLKHRYWRCVDSADMEELRECFVENASFKFIGGSYQVEFEGREKFLEFMRNVNSETSSRRISAGNRKSRCWIRLRPRASGICSIARGISGAWC